MRVKAVSWLVAPLAATMVSSAISPAACALDDPFWKKLKNTGSRMEVFGDYSGAEASYKQAIEAAKKTGADNLVIAELTARLATALVTQGKLAAAEPYYQSILSEVPRFSQSGTRQEDLLACVDALGESYSEKAVGNRALICLGHQKQLLETAFPQGYHPRLASCLISMADVLSQLQRYDESKTLLRQALRLTQRDIPKKEQYQVRAELGLAMVLEKMGEHEKAAGLVEHAMAFAAQHRLGSGFDVPTAHALLAICYENAGRRKEARKLFAMTETQLKITLSQLESKRNKRERDHLTLTGETCFLGSLYFTFNRTDLAVTTCKRAMELIEANLGQNNSALIGPMSILAKIERQRHNPSAAQRFEHRINAIKSSYATKI